MATTTKNLEGHLGLLCGGRCINRELNGKHSSPGMNLLSSGMLSIA